MSEVLRPGIDYIGTTTPFYCNDGKGNFVMHKRGGNDRDDKGVWDFGGGQVDFGEEIENSVLREVAEEWGVKGKIQEQLPAHSMLRTLSGIQTHWIAIPFFIKVDITKAKIMEPNKFTEMGIFRLDNLPTPLHTGIQFTMSHYSQYFERYR